MICNSAGFSPAGYIIALTMAAILAAVGAGTFWLATDVLARF
jgi:hypothetical protein